MNIAKYPRIWCPQCETIRPLIIDEMEAGPLNDHDAADLQCGDCKFVVATLHAVDPSSGVTT